MSEENKSNKENIDMDDLGMDLNNFFDNFVKSGVIIEEAEISDNFRVKIKVLGIGELVSAEAIMSQSAASPDIVAKVRSCSILSQAILEINSMPIEKESYSEKEKRLRRIILYKQLLKMPSIIIQKIYKFYVECVEKQNKLYTDVDKTVDNIRNF